MDTKLQVETIVAQPSETVYGFLKVGEMPDGTEASVPITIINGSKDGFTLYIQSASDGDELNGIAVIHRIIENVLPENLKGAIIAVPITNIFAFIYKQSESPIDSRKMNRCFPGKKDGTASFVIANRLFNSVVIKADLCIDLHQGGVSPMIDSLNVRIDRRDHMHKECMELARAFGIGYILDEKGPDGQLAQAAPEIGIPAIDPELGGTHGWDETSIQKGFNGVINVLKYYGMLDGEAHIPERQVVVRKLIPVIARRGGFIKYLANLYDIIEYRQPIADICDVFGRKIETVIAPKKGVLWSKNLYPMTFSDSTIALLGIDISYI